MALGSSASDVPSECCALHPLESRSALVISRRANTAIPPVWAEEFRAVSGVRPRVGRSGRAPVSGSRRLPRARQAVDRAAFRTGGGNFWQRELCKTAQV